MKWLVVLALAMVGCKRELPMGAPCEKTDQCGRGADCYRSVCTPLCANDSECADTLVCARHHCLTATGEPGVTQVRIPVHTPEPTPAAQPTQAQPALPTETRAPTPAAKTDAPDVRPGLRNSPAKIEPQRDFASELSAIRAELEALRQEQQRQAEILKRLDR